MIRRQRDRQTESEKQSERETNSQTNSEINRQSVGRTDNDSHSNRWEDGRKYRLSLSLSLSATDSIIYTDN